MGGEGIDQKGVGFSAVFSDNVSCERKGSDRETQKP